MATSPSARPPTVTTSRPSRSPPVTPSGLTLDALAGFAIGPLKTGSIQQRPPRFLQRQEGQRPEWPTSPPERARTSPAHRRGQRACPQGRLRHHRLDLPCDELRHPLFQQGTYIRAIARDAGKAAGVGAHLSALRRTSKSRPDSAKKFKLKDCLSIDAFLERLKLCPPPPQRQIEPGRNLPI